MVVSNRADNTVSIIDTDKLAVRSTVPVCQQPQDLTILPDSSKVFVACPGSNQLASIDLKSGRLLTLLDVGRLPIQLALKPDGGELFVSNFDGNSFSIVETGTTRSGAAI